MGAPQQSTLENLTNSLARGRRRNLGGRHVFRLVEAGEECKQKNQKGRKGVANEN
jgi:hypothetical protein